MDYQKQKDKIIIRNTKDFDPKDILECGQIFRYFKCGDSYIVQSTNKLAKITKINNCFVIETKDVDYFENFFDLKTDYTNIKKVLERDDFLSQVIKKGEGIRILKNDFYEVVISFVISANNNIARIKQIIERLCVSCGERIENNIYAFPKLEKLCEKDLNFFNSLKAGYRGKYLYKLVKELQVLGLDKLKNLDTKSCRRELIKLSGVGPKVADCILLFGLGRKDVFPVDTWIEKVYHRYYESGLKNRCKISEYFVEKYGDYSGYVQQYLFYAQRELKDNMIV